MKFAVRNIVMRTLDGREVIVQAVLPAEDDNRARAFDVASKEFTWIDCAALYELCTVVDAVAAQEDFAAEVAEHSSHYPAWQRCDTSYIDAAKK